MHSDDRSYTTEYGKRLALTTYVREFTAKHGSSAVRFLNADDSSRVRKRMKSTDGSSWNITSYFEHSSTASTSSSSLNPSPTSSTISTLSPPTNVDSNSCSESTVSSVSSPTNVIPSSLQGTGLSPSSASSIRLEVKDTVSTFNNVGRSDEVGEDDDDGDEEDTSYLSVGFSDDDPKNVEAIKALFEHTLSPEVTLSLLSYSYPLSLSLLSHSGSCEILSSTLAWNFLSTCFTLLHPSLPWSSLFSLLSSLPYSIIASSHPFLYL